MILFCCASELGLPEDLSAIEVILYYYYIIHMCHMHGEFKGKNVILQTDKQDHCHNIPFFSGSMQDKFCVLLSI